MQNLNDLLQQRAALDAQIEAARKAQVADAVAKCRAIIAEFALTEQDLFGGRNRRAPGVTSGAKVALKYRNPATGETWTGRGKAPKWIANVADRNTFLIA